jgi:hypothetical protein
VFQTILGQGVFVGHQEEEDVDGDLELEVESEEEEEETTETIIDIGESEDGEHNFSRENVRLLFLCPDDSCRLR